MPSNSFGGAPKPEARCLPAGGGASPLRPPSELEERIELDLDGDLLLDLGRFRSLPRLTLLLRLELGLRRLRRCSLSLPPAPPLSPLHAPSFRAPPLAADHALQEH